MPRERVNLQGLDLTAPATRSQAPEPEAEPAPSRIIPRSYETPQFAFVPVGLSPVNLEWIEDVIRRQKRNGDRQASRSKIIRALISSYGRQLERDLFPDTHMPIPPSAHVP